MSEQTTPGETPLTDAATDFTAPEKLHRLCKKLERRCRDLEDALRPFVQKFDAAARGYALRNESSARWWANMPDYTPMGCEHTMGEYRKAKAALERSAE